MPRRAVLLVLVASVVVTSRVRSQEPATVEPVIGPYLQWVTPVSAVIRWETEEETIGWVEYGGGGTIDRVARAVERRRRHEVPLLGLKAGTEYTYRVHWGANRSPEYTFRTAPAPGTRRFRVVCYGDSRSNPATHSRLVERIVAERPDLVISAGDLVSSGRVLEQWKPMFFDPLRPLMRSVCFWPSLGNHEQNAEIYYELFSLPEPEAWYSFDWGHVHFVALDSNQNFGPESEQVRWLEKDLRATRQPWKVAFFHHPLFSAHPSRSVNAVRWSWQPVLQRMGVQLVVAGHDHHYQRTVGIGPASVGRGQVTWHLTSGGGGASLYPVEQKIWTESARSVHHFVVLDFDGDLVRGRAITADGEEIDRFTIHRRAQPPGERFVAWEPILLERRIAEAVDREAPRSVEPGYAFSLRPRWQISLADLPSLSGEIEWEVTPGWSVVPGSDRFQAEAGRAWEWSVAASARWPECYPSPLARIRLDPGRFARGFRNSEMTLRPLRVWPRRSLVAMHVPPGRVTVDGRHDEPVWREVPEQSLFIRGDGTDRAPQQVRYRLASDGRTLYLAARIEQAEVAALEGGETARDAPRIVTTNEHVALRIASARHRYDFGVNAGGVRYDARDGDPGWDPDWSVRVTPVPGGWAVECAIPYEALDGGPAAGEREWRLNLQRYDRARDVRSEWVPTFGATADPSRYAFLFW